MSRDPADYPQIERGITLGTMLEWKKDDWTWGVVTDISGTCVRFLNLEEVPDDDLKALEDAEGCKEHARHARRLARKHPHAEYYGPVEDFEALGPLHPEYNDDEPEKEALPDGGRLRPPEYDDVEISVHAAERLGNIDSDEARMELPEYLAKKYVREQSGMLFYDEEYGSYHLVRDSTVIIFVVEDGTAVVVTAWRTQNHSNYRSNRYRRLN